MTDLNLPNRTPPRISARNYEKTRRVHQALYDRVTKQPEHHIGAAFVRLMRDPPPSLSSRDLTSLRRIMHAMAEDLFV